MDDDDDVILEGAAFHRHLQDLGYVGMETKRSISHQPLSLDRHKTTGETIDCDVIEEVLTLRAANLLFEDDLDHVDCIFANFELAKNEYFKFMFKGRSCFFVLALGLCFYLYMGSYAFVLVSIFYAYRTSDYLWNKRKRLRQLKKLMHMMQSNFTLLIRIIKFLFENEHMLKNRFGSKSSHKALNFVSSLKADFVDLQHDINRVLADATMALIEKVPLCEYLENPDCYICRNLNAYRNNESVSQLHSLYMLLQSQFLTRLIFSLIPNLVQNQKDDHYIAISEVVLKVITRFRDIQAIMNKKFKFALLNGIYLENCRSGRPLPPKERKFTASHEMLIKSIHDLSNSLQFSLIKARELEVNLENGENVDLEAELVHIQSELGSCQSHIADLLILNKKYSNYPLNQNARSRDSILTSKPTERVAATILGYVDLDAEVEDDIFECSTNGNDTTSDQRRDDYIESFEKLHRKRHKQMLAELKVRLKQQAEDWARREAIVLSRKGLVPCILDDEELWNPSNETDDDEDEDVSKRSQKLRKKYEESIQDHQQRQLRNPPNYQYDDQYQRAEGAALFAQALRQNQNQGLMEEDDFNGSGDNSEVED